MGASAGSDFGRFDGPFVDVEQMLLGGSIVDALAPRAVLRARQEFEAFMADRTDDYGKHAAGASPDCGTPFLGCPNTGPDCITIGPGCPADTLESACLCKDTNCGDCASVESVNSCQVTVSGCPQTSNDCPIETNDCPTQSSLCETAECGGGGEGGGDGGGGDGGGDGEGGEGRRDGPIIDPFHA